MKKEVRYLMSQKQLNRYNIISMAIEGKLTIKEAAERLNLSKRQIIRLKKGVKEEGAAFLIHKNTGRKPSHAISDEVKNQIIALKKSDKYKDANFLHFKELIETHENIKISYSALYSILTKAGIKSPKKRRKPKDHHRRKRRAQEGSLIQMDATPFEWFGGNEKFSLHGAIDDATGKIVGLYLCKNECLHGYFEVTRQILKNHGIPLSIYADRHSIFRSPKADKLSIEEQLEGKIVNDTQFGRAMNELGITLIPARSPQAKGRIERLWDTLQSRLPVEFKIAGIKTIEDANAFLVEYINKFNQKFAVEPANTESAYRQIPENICIDHILCVKQIRTVDSGSVFSFYNKHFQVVYNGQLAPIPARKKVTVLISPVFGVKAEYKNIVYDVIPFIKPKKKSNKNTQNKAKKVYKPSDDHYFKYGHTKWKKVTFEESDQEILAILQDIFLRKYA